MRGNPKQSLDFGLFHAVDSRFQIPIVRGIPNSFSLRASFPGALWRRGGKGAIPYLFERLFLIGWENNRDCHITMSLSLKTMEVQIKRDQWNKRFRTVPVYWEKRRRINYATMSLEFEFHLQFPCGSLSIELSDFRQPARMKTNIEKQWNKPSIMKSSISSVPILSSLQRSSKLTSDVDSPSDMNVKTRILCTLFSWDKPGKKIKDLDVPLSYFATYYKYIK